MEPSAGEPSHVDIQHRPARDKPSPLRVVKRDGHTAIVALTRASSTETDRSVQEPVTGGDHLTIMKRRSQRYDQWRESANGRDDPFQEFKSAREGFTDDRPKCNS